MTNLIAIILTFSFLFGVDSPKSESQITTDIQFDADTFQENQLIKKEMKKTINKPGKLRASLNQRALRFISQTKKVGKL